MTMRLLFVAIAISSMVLCWLIRTGRVFQTATQHQEISVNGKVAAGSNKSSNNTMEEEG
jgi:hypothetical protein